MALIKCPRCTRLISELATHCPNCELHLTEELISEIKAKQNKEVNDRQSIKSYYAGADSIYR